MILEAAAKGGGGFPSIIFIIALAFGAMWLIVIRPQRNKQKLQKSMQSDLAIGDEVVTAGGVYGTVTEIGDEEVRVEIAPNVEVRLARRAIAAQLTEHEPEAAVATADPPDASDEDEPRLDAESDEKNPG